MDKKQAYREKMEAQLKEWDARIDQLKAKAQQAKADAKIEYQEELETLRAKKAVMIQKLEELKNSSEEAWQVVKTGVENAASELKGAFERASSKFKQ